MSTTTCAPASASAKPSPVMVLTPEFGDAATTSSPFLRSLSTVFDPMSPLPPITTIFTPNLLTRFMRRGASAFSDARFVSSLGCVRACRVWPLVGGGWCVIGLGLVGSGDGGADLPRCSNDQPRQAAESQVPDRSIGSAGWQMDFDLGFHLDDAGGDLDQA